VETEVTFLVNLAREMQDAESRSVCAAALLQANPQNGQSWAVLEAAQTSGVTEIEKAARTRLDWRKRDKEIRKTKN
jgi:hypothetical protein